MKEMKIIIIFNLKLGDNSDGIQFWVKCKKSDGKEWRDLLFMEILPKCKANIEKIEKGRKETNLDPYVLFMLGELHFLLIYLQI